MALNQDEIRSLENDVLLAMRNREVITKILSQTEYYSKILPHIEIIDVDGDSARIVSIKSNEPKKWTLDYDAKSFSPSEVLTHKEVITDDDKLIFWTVLSESIERLAFGDGSKLSTALAKQSHQVAYDTAMYLDKSFVNEYLCNLTNYGKVVEMNDEQLKSPYLIGKEILTTLFKFTTPSDIYTADNSMACTHNHKNTLTFINNDLYASLRLASIHTSPSPILQELEKETTIIPVPMEDNFQVAIFDKSGIQLLRALTDRLLEHDKYINLHKILDHLWVKWVLIPFRNSFAILRNDNVNYGGYDTDSSNDTPLVKVNKGKQKQQKGGGNDNNDFGIGGANNWI